MHGSQQQKQIGAHLRLAQVANLVDPTTGGLRRAMDHLADDHLARGGARLRIASGPQSWSMRDQGDRRVEIAPSGLPGGGHRTRVHRSAILAELIAFRPDVVEVHDQTTLNWVADWARAEGVPCILFAHERLEHVAATLTGLPHRAFDRAFDRAGRRWAAHLGRKFDVVVCASEFTAEPFRAAQNVTVWRVPFGVDVDAFAPRPRRDELPWRPRSLRLVLAGGLSPDLEPQVALDVLAHLQADGIRVHLVVAGDGPAAARLRERARRERLPVTFLGHVADRAQLARLLAGADVALAPSGREALGLSILEALACGTPVVARNCGGARELLVRGAGATGASATEMAIAVRELICDPYSGHRARDHARRYSWAHACRTLSDLRSQLAANLERAPRSA